MSQWSRYPILGYQVLPYGDLELDLGGTVDTITLGTDGATAWGYALASGAAGSVAALLATALATHSYWGGSPPTLIATYELQTSAYAPRWRISTATAAVNVDIEVISGDDGPLQCLGLAVGDTATLTTITSSWASTRRWRGLWSPGDEAAVLEPVYGDLGDGSRNPYDPAYHDRLRLGRQLVWACSWGMVDAADISRELVAQDAGLQAMANRTPDDTQGTLDDVLGAAGSGYEIRLVLSSSGSRDCVLVDTGTLRRDAYTSEESVGGRRYGVTLGLMQASAYEGVVT